MIARAFGLIAAVLRMTAGSSAEEAAKKEQEQLQGQWAIQSMEYDGHPRPMEKLKSVKLVIAGERLTVQGEKGMELTIKLDPSKKPRHIDFIPGDGPDKGKVLPGIYELQGDELKLCLSKAGKDRPTEFVSKENSGVVLIVLKREKS